MTVTGGGGCILFVAPRATAVWLIRVQLKLKSLPYYGNSCFKKHFIAVSRDAGMDAVKFDRVGVLYVAFTGLNRSVGSLRHANNFRD